MWITKISKSLLCFQTPVGPRYTELALGERFSVAWMFRNFSDLPLTVLNENQLRRVQDLRARATEEPVARIEDNVIGTLDCAVARKPIQRVVFERSERKAASAAQESEIK